MKLTYNELNFLGNQIGEILKRDDLNGKLIVKLRSALGKIREAVKPLSEMLEDWQKKIQAAGQAEADAVTKEAVSKKLTEDANDQLSIAGKQETEVSFDPIKLDDLLGDRKIKGELIMSLMDAGLVVE